MGQGKVTPGALKRPLRASPSWDGTILQGGDREDGLQLLLPGHTPSSPTSNAESSTGFPLLTLLEVLFSSESGREGGLRHVCVSLGALDQFPVKDLQAMALDTDCWPAALLHHLLPGLLATASSHGSPILYRINWKEFQEPLNSFLVQVVQS